jgi:hypothetical protein
MMMMYGGVRVHHHRIHQVCAHNVTTINIATPLKMASPLLDLPPPAPLCGANSPITCSTLEGEGEEEGFEAVQIEVDHSNDDCDHGKKCPPIPAPVKEDTRPPLPPGRKNCGFYGPSSPGHADRFFEAMRACEGFNDDVEACPPEETGFTFGTPPEGFFSARLIRKQKCGPTCNCFPCFQDRRRERNTLCTIRITKGQVICLLLGMLVGLMAIVLDSFSEVASLLAISMGLSYMVCATGLMD